MRREKTARSMVVLGAMALFFAGGLAANAAPPEREPYTPDPTVLEPGQACNFDVEIAQVPGSNFTQTVFNGGKKTVITGSGHDQVTNLDADLSLTLPTSGKLTMTEQANGDLRVRASGRTVFYFYAGDQGPYGLVGDDGALYYIVGHVDEILDGDSGFVTSFRWRGRARELCSLISG